MSREKLAVVQPSFREEDIEPPQIFDDRDYRRGYAQGFDQAVTLFAGGSSLQQVMKHGEMIRLWSQKWIEEPAQTPEEANGKQVWNQ